ncbi:MAG TPA: potassium-transporting ATPase subunit KdpA [Vicinamibacterales bacterium]|jgi:K+-transporting ATPase ATPase A chain|nr:potassium-transporting ATPase subunit KdpA [Vicinamibacterales bacterium]
MALADAAQYLTFLAVVTLLVRPLGRYVECVFARHPTALDRPLLPIERGVYRLCRIDPAVEMTAAEYGTSFVLFGVVGTVVVYGVLQLQRFLPWFFPEYHTTILSPDLTFNTAVSFATTTTWQAYSGETTMSYTSQMVALCAQNFLAGAAGLAVGVAFMRGFAREGRETLGNFWGDLTRALLWILLPGAVIGAALLVWQGVPMNLLPYTIAAPLDSTRQVIAQGPVAALEIIKNLGTNGGGFFNANGAHPFENPTALTNLIELVAIVAVPAALTNTFGRMTGQPRQGWLLYWVMVILFVAGLAAVHVSERGGTLADVDLAGGNMEGKEARFGVAGSALTAAVTSNSATGSYNSMHDSYRPLGGAVLLANMLLGEVVFGGLGTGLYSLVMAALIAVFLAGLMIGRTPEYLGKKIGPSENKMIVCFAILGPLTLLPLAATAAVIRPGLAGLTTNSGPHGLTEILVAYASSFANNGQSFAGLSANSLFYNLTTAAAMLVGRFGLAIPALALAGCTARQGRAPVTIGILRTDSPTFGVLVVGSLVIVTVLSYLPALVLGPVLERLTTP